MRTVALSGNSLVVSSLGASLQGRAELQVSFVHAALQPDVIISDLAMAHPRLLLIVLAIYAWQRRSVPGALVFAVAHRLWRGFTFAVQFPDPVADAEPDREVVEGR